jgi:sugar phosphate isomerase/epimerase
MAMSDWPVGLSTGCFSHTSIFDCLPDICTGGFSMLEICSFPAHLDYHDGVAVGRAAEAMRDLSLEPYSFHAPYGEDIDITSLDDRRRRSSRDEMLQAAEAASRLGVWHFVVHPGPEFEAQPPASERLQRLRNAVAVLDEISVRCRELGIGLVLENMLPHLLFGNASDMLWIMGALKKVEIGICLDTGHAHLAGDSTEVVRKFRGHLRMVHAHDNRGERDDHLPPGDGAIDWHAVLTQLHDERFGGGLILEIAGDTHKNSRELVTAAREARWRLRRVARRIALGERDPHIPLP